MPKLPDFTLPPFFVYVIESNKVEEILERLSEGLALTSVLKFAGVPVKYHTSVAIDDFAIQIGRAFTYAQQINRFPIIHLSAHGGLRGIQLTTGQVVTWRDLASMLEPLHHLSNSNYLLCLSACEGLASVQVALSDPNKPLFGIVGTSKVVDWSDNVVGFAAFYHLLQKGKSIREAVEGMKSASGHDTYTFVYGATVVETFKEFLNKT